MSSKLQDKASYESSTRGFLHRQFKEHPPAFPKGRPLAQKTVIVTGSNTGLGLEACKQFLTLGASRLVMAVRSLAKGEAAASRLRKEMAELEKNFTILVWELDMQSYASIRAFVRRCDAELDRIDISVLNAGLGTHGFHKDPDTGHEVTMQVNYFGAALLSTLLVPVIRSKKSLSSPREPPRLCIVGSDTAYMSKIDASKPLIPQAEIEKSYSQFENYSLTKLLVLMFTTKLAEKVNADDVLICCVNPGMTAGTGLNADIGNMFIRPVLRFFQKAIGREVKVGASTFVDAMVTQDTKSHGSFVSDWTIKPYPEVMYTDAGKTSMDALWKSTMEELGQPEL